VAAACRTRSAASALTTMHTQEASSFGEQNSTPTQQREQIRRLLHQFDDGTLIVDRHPGEAS
jgi:hypothetical protein